MALLVMLEASGSLASTAVVPDQYASIQLALASPADTIRVRPGSYDPMLEIGRAVVLTTYPPSPPYFPAIAPPRVGSVRIHTTGQSSQVISVNGLRITGGVRIQSCWTLTFQECRVDSGIIDGSTGGCGSVKVRGCVVSGGIDLSPDYAEISSCSVLGEGVRVRYSLGWTAVFNNLILGPGAFGIRLSGNDGQNEVSDNLVAGYTTGVSILTGSFGANVARNEIRDCVGNGCTITSSSELSLWSGTMSDNWIHRCGAHGFDLSAFVGTIRNNVVDSVGGAGVRIAGRGYPSLLGNRIVHAGAEGVLQSGGTNRLRSATENVILGAGADGMSFGFGGADSIAFNVIGHAAGRGLYTNTNGYARIAHNTVYSCGADGISLIGGGALADSVWNNIAANNLGCGLRSSGGGTTALSCNDWFANSGGAVCGTAIGASDLQVDPQFCNLPSDDVSLAATSPLLNAAGCGLIGARGVGCTAVVGVPPGADVPWSLTALPSPSRGQVRFTWPREQGSVRLELFDLAGARRWMADADGMAGVRNWQGEDSEGRTLPPGVYFARLTAGTRSTHARVVLVR